MKQSRGKQIVYRYNGDSSGSRETISDPRGTMAVPLLGEILQRNGKKWHVVGVSHEIDMKGPLAVPIHQVFLRGVI